jgi:serine acetyltransferase
VGLHIFVAARTRRPAPAAVEASPSTWRTTVVDPEGHEGLGDPRASGAEALAQARHVAEAKDAGGSRAAGSVLRAIREDFRFTKGLRRLEPGRPPASWSWPRVALGSRGTLMLAMSRIGWAFTSWRPAGSSGRLLKRALRGGMILGTRAIEMLSRSQIAPGSVIEGGVHLSDRGHVVIGVRKMGAGTIVHHHVTIGRGVNPGDTPEIGRGVWIGPHCVVYGRVRLGDGVTVLPHSVLSTSVPDGAVVQGNPARVVRRGFDNTALRQTLATASDPLPGATGRA